MNPPAAPATFLEGPARTEQVDLMFTSDLQAQGYVANLTRLWAHAPEALVAESLSLEEIVVSTLQSGAAAA